MKKKIERYWYYSPYFRNGTKYVPELITKPISVSSFFVSNKNKEVVISDICKDFNLSPYEAGKSLSLGDNLILEKTENSIVIVSAKEVDEIYKSPQLPNIFIPVIEDYRKNLGHLYWCSDLSWVNLSYNLIRVTDDLKSFAKKEANIEISSEYIEENKFINSLLKEKVKIAKIPFVECLVDDFKEYNILPSSWLSINYGMCCFVKELMSKHGITQKQAWSLAFFGYVLN